MNEHQFREFYETTRLHLRAYVVRSTGDANLADDIVQEAFVRLLGAGIAETDSDGLRRYLFRVASNLMRDHWRRQEHRTSINPEEIVELPGQPDDPLAGHDMNDALSRLSPMQRSLMWLAYVEGHPHREIAAMLKLKEKSIRVLLHRTRTKLLDILTEMGLTRDE
jgi:RNA polymerase sigma-70 factor (ECF subfamily)